MGPARGLAVERDETRLLAQIREGVERLSSLSGEEAEEHMGRLLFDLVTLADLKGVDAEGALRKRLRELDRDLS